jgi:hypothetical protein
MSLGSDCKTPPISIRQRLTPLFPLNAKRADTQPYPHTNVNPQTGD